MDETQIQAERIQKLNDRPMRTGKYAVYWMQASQRTIYNHTLEYAILTANKLKQPLIVYFGLTADFPEANERHYRFMLEGLQDVKKALDERGIFFCLRRESPEKGIIALSRTASAVITDHGYLRIQKNWRSDAATNIDCPLIQVESDCVVPVETASPKEEYAAATIRPKIHRLLPVFLKPLDEFDIKVKSLDFDLDTLDMGNIDRVISDLGADRSVKPVEDLTGGMSRAADRLEDFIGNKLEDYPEARNDPNKEALSCLSPFLHFGQISPLYIALRALESRSRGADAFLEELVIRRELSLNFVHYNPLYDSFAGLPGWAKKTLKTHETDMRPYVYTRDELETAATHDKYWNAAQIEMKTTGKMHGYMRMYWGKKILEWTEKPEEAFAAALYLNNKYELDGRDPNGFTGVAWCFGKHDRPWAERAVFGNIRYMNDKGLRRKFDADVYAKRFL